MQRLVGAGLWFVITLVLFGWNASFPPKIVHDEVYYVPAATSLLAGEMPENFQHPLTGKALIALGMTLFDDQALGPRAMGVVFGALTVAFLFLLGFGVFRNSYLAHFCALFGILSQCLMVQARIAMLDIYLVGFLIIAFSFVALGKDDRRSLRIASVFFGLAASCKWFGFAPFAIVMSVYFYRHRRVDAWALLIAPLVYIVTQLPLFFLTGGPGGIIEFFQLQLDAYRFLSAKKEAHLYMSEWWSWPLSLRPIWYYFSNDAGRVRGIICLLNPALSVASVISLVGLSFFAWKKRSFNLFVPILLYLSCLLPWILIPRSVSYYNYYLPAAAVTPLVIVGFINCLGNYKKWVLGIFSLLVLTLFIYFFPLLVASEMDYWDFVPRIWLRSWV